jgi:hypothetical protein
MTDFYSEYRVKKMVNGASFYAEIGLTITETENGTLEVCENYSGEVFSSQGSLEQIPENGYNDWKKGILAGIEYAFQKLKNNNGLKVTVNQASGLSTETNPVILGFAASRAILKELEHSESDEQLAQIEIYVFGNDGFRQTEIPDFKLDGLDL